ncbi:hypothetical protein CSB11_01555 [Candidatus Campbellbacteria bacterium]|nr:MAG: hypothetical protein CSB11_01555 [Candidatus Campbellbacteria bacterium]
MKNIIKKLKAKLKKRKENKKKAQKGFQKKSKWKVFRKIIFWLIIISLLGWAFHNIAKKFYGNQEKEQNFLIIEPVSKGDVSSSFTAEGMIKAERKQNLDVYKKNYRLDLLKVKNGSSVKKGDILFAFDSSDYSTSIQRAYISYQKALLDFQNQKVLKQISQDIGNSEIALGSLERTILRKKQEVKELREKFYSKNLELIPNEDGVSDDEDIEKPTISGEYKLEKEGQYEIEIYNSSTKSGYSFRYTGLENGVGSVIFGKPQDLGKNGLEINFSPQSLDDCRKWILKVPNTEHKDYKDNEREYKEALEDLIDFYKRNELDLKSSKQKLKHDIEVDQHNFDIQEGRLALNEALKAYQDAKRDRDELVVKAPFDGIINGMQDVTVGEKPKDTDDVMKFGTLISNDFVVEFALQITDLEKIKIGQEIDVDANLGFETKTLKAEIEQIGALPEGGLYPVVAKIVLGEEKVFLKEGVAATVKIISESKEDVLKIPNSAISYDADKKYVLLVIQTQELQKSKDDKNSEDGIVSLEENKVITEKKFIVTGLEGLQYTEIKEGLKEGDKIVTTTQIQSGQTDYDEFGGGGKMDEEMSVEEY